MVSVPHDHEWRFSAEQSHRIEVVDKTFEIMSLKGAQLVSLEAQ